MFGLFRNKKTEPTDLSFLSTDMHSHLLPALDDGAEDIEQSVQLITEMRALGYRKLICTPHVMADMYRNTPASISEAHAKLEKRLADNGPADIEIAYAAEYMLDEGFTLNRNNHSLLKLTGNYLLIEMSYLAESPFLHNEIFELSLSGYQPVLAHPERYNFYHNDYAVYRKLCDAGCLLQVNLLSFTGYYGPAVKNIATRLLKDKLITLAGSDVHHMKHIAALKTLSRTSVWTELKNYPFLNHSWL
ncbi:tyrosine-protein phosphatase [Sediminibacterium ginsengisoli]|nr:CpsB/CapC family capsule biosynthesis tyrosine phosphatase [Sediminibacterium ginsengisoli]